MLCFIQLFLAQNAQMCLFGAYRPGRDVLRYPMDIIDNNCLPGLLSPTDYPT